MAKRMSHAGRGWAAIGAVGVMAALALAGGGGVGLAVEAQAPTKRIAIHEFKYAPASIEVPVGARVTWTNGDEEPHTITSRTGAFASAGLDHDEAFSQTFSRPGKYPYFCALHPYMTGTVIVR
jgi:plastocyanin